jgi:hypothetical protein
MTSSVDHVVVGSRSYVLGSYHLEPMTYHRFMRRFAA